VHIAEAAISELRERILAASASGSALRLRGAGTKDFYGEHLEGEILDLTAHRGIVSYEPSELVLTARCGTPLSQIEAALAAEGQLLPFEPPRFGADPTIGGVIAAGLSGPGRMQLGAVRDFVLGARLLDAHADHLRFGGEVMKNVAGFDVARLLCGSLGILGVITEVSLKVLPLPRAQATLRLELAAPDALRAFNRWAGEPLPLSAAAWHEGAAWIRLSGAVPAVGAACTRIGGEVVDAGPAHSFWQGLRDMTLPYLAREPLWRIAVPTTAAPLALAATPLIDWAGALRWYSGVTDGSDARAQAVAASGTAMCFRGPAHASTRFHPLSAVALKLHRRLKDRFDPRRIFNRSRLVAGL
jgi:glycolate oxidase FAD binding subunit